jgi:hypothetical protein
MPLDERSRAALALEHCIFVHARNLSLGTDSADTIAKGVITLCQTEENQAESLDAEEAKRLGATLSEPNVITKGTEMYVVERARTRVLESRAYRCLPISSN